MKKNYINEAIITSKYSVSWHCDWLCNETEELKVIQVLLKQ